MGAEIPKAEVMVGRLTGASPSATTVRIGRASCGIAGAVLKTSQGSRWTRPPTDAISLCGGLPALGRQLSCAKSTVAMWTACSVSVIERAHQMQEVPPGENMARALSGIGWVTAVSGSRERLLRRIG